MSKGVLAVVSGPSGAGKGTVVKAFMEKNSDTYLSISATTRLPREGEEHGKHYFFVSRDEFEDMIKRGELLEYAEYAGNYYGTPAAGIDRQLDEGRNVILEIEMQGGKKVRAAREDCVLVFLTTPTAGELERRLRKRSTETEDKILKRLEIAKTEYSNIDKYDYIVINGNISDAVEELEAIFKAERCRVRNRQMDIEKI